MLRQIDIVDAFLNGELEEEIFMKQPEGFIQPGTDKLVYRLVKALYGLKQAGRVWNKRLDSFLVKNLKFVRLQADPCVYLKKNPHDNKFAILGIHVDDILMAHNSKELSDQIVTDLADGFETTDLGYPSRLLGMRITQDPSTGSISLDQEAYIKETLKRFT